MLLAKAGTFTNKVAVYIELIARVRTDAEIKFIAFFCIEFLFEIVKAR